MCRISSTGNLCLAWFDVLAQNCCLANSKSQFVIVLFPCISKILLGEERMRFDFMEVWGATILAFKLFEGSHFVHYCQR